MDCLSPCPLGNHLSLWVIPTVFYVLSILSKPVNRVKTKMLKSIYFSAVGVELCIHTHIHLKQRVKVYCHTYNPSLRTI